MMETMPASRLIHKDVSITMGLVQDILNSPAFKCVWKRHSYFETSAYDTLTTAQAGDEVKVDKFIVGEAACKKECLTEFGEQFTHTLPAADTEIERALYGREAMACFFRSFPDKVDQGQSLKVGDAKPMNTYNFFLNEADKNKLRIYAEDRLRRDAEAGKVSDLVIVALLLELSSATSPLVEPKNLLKVANPTDEPCLQPDVGRNLLTLPQPSFASRGATRVEARVT